VIFQFLCPCANSPHYPRRQFRSYFFSEGYGWAGRVARSAFGFLLLLFFIVQRFLAERSLFCLLYRLLCRNAAAAGLPSFVTILSLSPVTLPFERPQRQFGECSLLPPILSKRHYPSLSFSPSTADPSCLPVQVRIVRVGCPPEPSYHLTREQAFLGPGEHTLSSLHLQHTPQIKTLAPLFTCSTPWTISFPMIFLYSCFSIFLLFVDFFPLLFL